MLLWVLLPELGIFQSGLQGVHLRLSLRTQLGQQNPDILLLFHRELVHDLVPGSLALLLAIEDIGVVLVYGLQ